MILSAFLPMSIMLSVGAQDSVPPQQTGSPVQQPPTDQPASQVEDVVVTGSLRDSSSRIDRRVYSLRDRPDLEISTLVEILGKLPSVTVTPSGRVSLLGAPGVTVLVDGKPVADPGGYLRSATGTRVDRIEVMTNPPAEFSAQGTGGIINIITRRSALAGLSGTFGVSLNSLGGGGVSISPNLTIGRWAATGSLRATHTENESDSTRRRTVLGSSGSSSVETAQTRSSQNGQAVEGTLAYKLSETQTLTSNMDLSRSDGRSRTGSDVTFTNGVGNYTQAVTTLSDFDVDKIGAGYERTGPGEGEQLNLDLSASRLKAPSENLFEQNFDDSSRSVSVATSYLENKDYSANAKYQRTFSNDRLFSSGIGFDGMDRYTSQTFETLEGPSNIPTSNDELDGWRGVTSGYATFQFPWKGWTVLPGLRVEHDDVRVEVDSVSARRQRTDVFPSFFLRRSFAENWTSNFSYSRRINRPDPAALSPALTYSSPTEANSGNPDLEPEFTDSLELRLEYRKDASNFSLTGYSRRTTGVFDQSIRLVDQTVFVYSPVNAGIQQARGIEVSVEGRVFQRLKYTLSGNGYWRDRDAAPDLGVAAFDAFAYSFNGQLEYRQASSNGRAGDTYQLSLSYSGPQRSLQTRSDRYLRLDAVWRHPLTAKTSLVVGVNDILDSSHSRTVIETAQLRETVDTKSPGPTLRIALSRRFGGGS